MECPMCGMQVIAGLAKQAYAEHYQDNFSKRLELAISNGGVVIKSYEVKT